MCRKRIGQRKYLYCFLAGLTMFLLFGCSSLQQSRLSGDLQNAEELYARGDFEGGLKANQNIMSLCEKKPPCEQALFNMGLIYASNNYAKKDYRKSMAMFQRVVREYPQSSLVPQARTWIGVLAVIERSKDIDIEIERTKKKLAR